MSDMHQKSMREEVLEKIKRGEVTVLITPSTRLPLGYDFVLGDSVVIMGEQEDGVVRAFGVRKIDKEFGGEFNRMGPPRHLRLPWFPPEGRE